MQNSTEHKREPKQSQETVFSKECPSLLTHHFQQLHNGSGISVDVIKERGYESVLGKKRLADLGFSKAQQRTPGILIPSWSVDGQQIGCQYHPDRPRQDRRGRVVKYETPKGTPNRIDCPPQCQKQLADPSILLNVTEGAKKGDCLASQGLCVIDIPGVWSWKSKNEFGGITISSDFDNIAFNGRQVYLEPDSDIATIPGVRQACLRLAEHLKRKGASISVVYLSQEGTEKMGVDDFIVAGHTVEQLLALAVPLEEVPEEKEKEKEIYSCYAYYQNKLYLEVRRLDGSYAFAYLKENGVGLVPEIVAGDLKLRPRPLPVSEGRTVAFVGMPDENIMTAQLLSPSQLYREIKAHFRKYIDLSDLDLQLCIYYCVFTWFYRKVNTLGYLRFQADTGKGKSRIQTVTGDLCFYPIYSSGASSFSGTARQQNKWRGTLIIDESDFHGEKEAQFIKYLNLGFEKGKPYVLSDKQNPKFQEFFDPFNPKILAMRKHFKDSATEGRMLSISPHETSNDSIPIILLSNYSQETQTLRNTLARFALEHWNELDGEKMLDFHHLGIEPRLQQLAMPMSVIFQLWPEGTGEFRQYLIRRQQEIRKVRSQSWEGSLFNIVYSIAVGDLELQEEFGSYYEPQSKEIQAITPGMIARQMKTTGKLATDGLTAIGFEIERRNITAYTKDNGESKGKRKTVRAYVVSNEKAWQEIVSRYYYQEDTGESDIQLPEILMSKRFVSFEVSQPSQPSQKEEPTTNSCDTCDTCDGLKDTEDKKDSKNTIKPSPDQSIQKILGMTKERAIAIWDKQGRSVIYLGPGENCHDLAKVLEQREIKPEHLSAIGEWLEKSMQEEATAFPPAAELQCVAEGECGSPTQTVDCGTGEAQVRNCKRAVSKVAIINSSYIGTKAGKRIYNLGVDKIAQYHRLRGDEVYYAGPWVPMPENRAADKFYFSVIFTWDILKMIRQVNLVRDWGKEVEIGGPAATFMHKYIHTQTGIEPHRGLDERFEHIPPLSWLKEYRPKMTGGDYKLTFSSRGCPHRCAFCGVRKLEREALEYDDFPMAPMIGDNNILATSWKHQELVVNKYANFRGKIDINSGFDIRFFTKEHLTLYSRLRLKYWRFAWDTMEVEADVRRVVAIMRNNGLDRHQVTFYCLIGFPGQTPEECLYRLNTLIGLGLNPYAMRFWPLNSLNRKYVAPGWTENLLQRMTAYYQTPSLWKSVSWENYRPGKKTCRACAKVINKEAIDE